MNQNHYVLGKHQNGYWYYYIYRYGKRVYRSTGEKKKAAALEVVLERLERNDLINANKHTKSHLFREYVEPFWDYERCPIVQDKLQRGGHVSKQMCHTYRLNVQKYLIPTFGTKALEEITTDMVNRFLRSIPDKFGVTPQTANKVLLQIRQILEQAVNEGILPNNPAKIVKPLIAKPKRRGCFSSEDVKKLFSSQWSDIYIEAMVHLAATTGMRQGEIQALCREQIKDNYIEIDRSWANMEGLKTTKNGHPRIVPILPEIRKALLELPSNGQFIFTYNGDTPISKEVISRKLKNQMDLCGIDYKCQDLSFHSFRHFFNTRLVADGVDLERVRSVIGHESEQMTEHYLHLSVSDMDVIRKVQAKIWA